MSAPATCASCAAWFDLGHDVGLCRRHAPTTRDTPRMGEWPRTYARDWCLEWVAKPLESDSPTSSPPAKGESPPVSSSADHSTPGPQAS
jgi:hypothetical protein